MKSVGQLEITTPSDREIAMTRTFDAPRRLVFDAWTKPELLSRWLGVFGGHTMTTCEVDLRVGGKYRWVWSTPNQPDMGMGGVFREVVVPERLVATEKFDDPWYEGEAIVTTTFTEKGGRTTVTSVMKYDSRKIRDAVLASPMETGVAASYDALERILAAQEA
jgi:uncharacterized protein YndB with AHSA1/START domain